MAASIKHLDNDGYTQISGEAWPDAFAGESQTARKFTVENNGTRALGSTFNVSIEQIGTNDADGMLRIGADIATLSKPFNVVAALTASGAGGVWSGTGLKYYRLTAYNATGETIGSTEISINVDDVTKKVVLTWDEIVGATGYKVYRSETSGSYTVALRATVVGSSTTTYTDDGSATGAGDLPTENTTGGAAPTYGTVPSLDIIPIAIGVMEIGQQWFYWVNRVVPSSSPETGNPRRVNLKFSE